MPAKLTVCLWGSTGHGKSQLLSTFARGQWKATGKKTRLVSAESAQGQGLFAEGIAEGYILPWWLDARTDQPFARMIDAVLGYWPEDPEEPFSRRIPAFTIKYVANCPKEGCPQGQTPVYQSDKAPQAASSLVCPKCKTPAIVRTQRERHDKRLDEVGAYVFEGLTEFSDMLMKDMSRRSAAGEKMGEDVAVRFKDGDVEIAGSSRSSYGVAQRQMKNRVDESKHLPVDYVLWSAGREDGVDRDRNGVTVFGPKIAGSAATADVPRWFGPTLSAVAVPMGTPEKPAEPEFRLYLSKYYQTWLPLQAKLENVCNNRIPPHRMNGIPPFVVVKPEDDICLWKVLRQIEERQAPQPPSERK